MRGSVIALAFLIASASPAAEPVGGNPCDILPWQTTDNGTGAEAGVIREFASQIVMPAGCHRAGKVWVPRIRLGLTRTALGDPDMQIRVSLREPSSIDGPVSPPGERTTPVTYTIENVPIFPNSITVDLDTAPNNNQNINLIHRDTTFFVSVDMDGDATEQQFLVTDLQGPLNDDCFTETTPSATGGEEDATAAPGLEVPVAWELCINGIIDLNEAAQGATGYTFYGRYSGQFNGDAVDGREPLGTTWGARYLNGGAFANGTRLTVWRDDVGPLVPDGRIDICEFLDIPEDFEFQCTLTSEELDLLAEGRIFVELANGASVESVRMIPADRFIFADGFESGDTSVWSTVVE